MLYKKNKSKPCFRSFRDELNSILKQQQAVFKNDLKYIQSKQSIRKINAQINLYKKQKDELFTFLLNHTITKNDFVKQNKRLDNNLEYYENELQLFHSTFHTTFETIDTMNEPELEKFIREYMPRRSVKL